MNTAIICFSDRGAALAKKICALLNLPLCRVHSIEKFALPHGFTSHKTVCADMGEIWGSSDALIFISACGIAVRDIAPHLKSKAIDPAVLVIDDNGRFVIPILSGHIGGANALASVLAEKIGAEAVITTATDGMGKFACDSWAVTHGCALSSLKAAKDVSAAILKRDVALSSEFPLPDTLPDGLKRAESGDIGIYIGIHKTELYDTTLRLIPKIVTLGIGCRRNAEKEKIRALADEVMEENNIDFRSVCGIASIDVKKDEMGLLAFADEVGLPLQFYSAEELQSAKGEFNESEFVRGTVGVGNVCERAAVLCGGSLIIHKTAKDGVTAAAAIKEWSVTF